MPRFVLQRSLYEVRERPSKAYSWKAFLVANIIVEIPYQIFVGIIVWASLYFPVFGANQPTEVQGLWLLYSMQFQIFTSTFAHMLIAGLPDAETAGNIATTMFSLILTFNGVLQPPSALPGFWLFMWRVSPLTYTVGGLAAISLHGREVECASNELAVFDPPNGQTCEQYLAPYLEQAPGQLYNGAATSRCEYCPISNGDQFLASSRVYWDQRWRNFGIGWAYIGFNIMAAVWLYWFFRVRKRGTGGGAKAWIGKLFWYVSQAGWWVRHLFVRHPSWKHSEKRRAANDKIF
jgi:ATP-binding cassette, subfamily G (WHITE), member 2, PDR